MCCFIMHVVQFKYSKSMFDQVKLGKDATEQRNLAYKFTKEIAQKDQGHKIQVRRMSELGRGCAF